MKKAISMVLKSALVIVYAASLAGYMMIRPRLSTLCSVEKLNDHPFYQMNYSGDYYFDEYLEHGGATIEDTINFVAEQMGIEKPFESSGSGFGCSTVYSPTTDGDYIFARNFDYPSAAALLIHTAPDDGYESVSMVNLEHMGYDSENYPDGFVNRVALLFAPYCPLDGMNEKGVAIGVLQLDNKPTAQNNGKVDIMTTTAIRLVLDYAADVEEAIELLSQYDMHSLLGSNFHYQISDAQGNSAIVEYKNNQMCVYRSEEEYQFCTNFYITDMMNGSGVERQCPRYQGLTQAFEQVGGHFSNEDIEALAEKMWVNYAQSSTQWTSVFNLSDLSYDIYINMDGENPYHYDFADTWATDTAIIAADAVFCAVGVLIVACFVFGFIRRKNKAKKSAE